MRLKGNTILIHSAGIQQRFNILKADAKDNWSYFRVVILRHP
jgi:hypothetical protein